MGWNTPKSGTFNGTYHDTSQTSQAVSKPFVSFAIFIIAFGLVVIDCPESSMIIYIYYIYIYLESASTFLFAEFGCCGTTFSPSQYVLAHLYMSCTSGTGNCKIGRQSMQLGDM